MAELTKDQVLLRAKKGDKLDYDKLFADVMRYDRAPLFPNPDGSPGGKAAAMLVRWTFDLAGASESVLDGVANALTTSVTTSLVTPSGRGRSSGPLDDSGQKSGLLWHCVLRTSIFRTSSLPIRLLCISW